MSLLTQDELTGQLHYSPDTGAFTRRVGRRCTIGYFGSPEAASAAYEAKATELFGAFKRQAA